MARAWLIESRLQDGLCEEPRTKIQSAQAVRGMGEQLFLERAQGIGGESPKLTCAGTALDSKCEKRKLACSSGGKQLVDSMFALQTQRKKAGIGSSYQTPFIFF